MPPKSAAESARVWGHHQTEACEVPDEWNRGNVANGEAASSGPLASHRLDDRETKLVAPVSAPTHPQSGPQRTNREVASGPETTLQPPRPVARRHRLKRS